jgi:hypothetical protein
VTGDLVVELKKSTNDPKEELLWLRELYSPFELTDALDMWIEDYEQLYLHSMQGYRSPIKFKKEYERSIKNNYLPLLPYFAPGPTGVQCSFL